MSVIKLGGPQKFSHWSRPVFRNRGGRIKIYFTLNCSPDLSKDDATSEAERESNSFK